MKCSFGISDFLEEIPSLSHSVVFLYFFALITKKAFLSPLAILWNSAFRCLYLSFSPLLFTSLLFTAFCKASPDSHFAFFAFLFHEYTEELYNKDLHNPDNHDGVITHLEPDILECEVKWALGSVTINKASGGDGIPVELFQILKDNAVKMLHSMSANLENSAVATGLEKVSFHSNPKGNAKECSRSEEHTSELQSQ